MIDPLGFSLPMQGTHPAALASRVRPALVLDELVARELLLEAKRLDIAVGGRFSAGIAGVQVWSGPWRTRDDAGDAVHLGSVNWTYNTPARNYVTIYRTMVTKHGIGRGETTESVLRSVLTLGNLDIDGPRIEQPLPPERDPFQKS
ncbi:MAG TPA: hypothetical protein VNA14_03200 [Mycobacteriales bacterium]|nr:hypothetical protein [Mycobacteriales bacterium]